MQDFSDFLIKCLLFYTQAEPYSVLFSFYFSVCFHSFVPLFMFSLHFWPTIVVLDFYVRVRSTKLQRKAQFTAMQCTANCSALYNTSLQIALDSRALGHCHISCLTVRGLSHNFTLCSSSRSNTHGCCTSCLCVVPTKPCTGLKC